MQWAQYAAVARGVVRITMASIRFEASVSAAGSDATVGSVPLPAEQAGYNAFDEHLRRAGKEPESPQSDNVSGGQPNPGAALVAPERSNAAEYGGKGGDAAENNTQSQAAARAAGHDGEGLKKQRGTNVALKPAGEKRSTQPRKKAVDLGPPAQPNRAVAPKSPGAGSGRGTDVAGTEAAPAQNTEVVSEHAAGTDDGKQSAGTSRAQQAPVEGLLNGANLSAANTNHAGDAAVSGEVTTAASGLAGSTIPAGSALAPASEVAGRPSATAPAVERPGAVSDSEASANTQRMPGVAARKASARPGRPMAEAPPAGQQSAPRLLQAEPQQAATGETGERAGGLLPVPEELLRTRAKGTAQPAEPTGGHAPQGPEAVAGQQGRLDAPGSGPAGPDHRPGPAIDPADRVRFVQRVARAMEAAEARGIPLRIRLHPPELGSLRIEVTVRNGGMSARVEAETEAARTLLLDHLPLLRERLAEHHLRIERFDVQWSGASSGGLSERPGQQGPGQPFPHAAVPEPRRPAAPASPSPPGLPRRATSSQIDIMI